MFFVVNERAGGGRGRRVFRRIEHRLRPEDGLAITSAPGETRRIATEAALAGHDRVVAVGGDGTINEVVSGLADCGFKAALGVIPGGGGNDFAYALGLPKQAEEALDLVRAGATRALDVGLLRIEGGDERYFVNMLGMGLSGTVAAVAREPKAIGGDLSYLVQLLVRLFSARPLRFTVSTDEGTTITRAIAANLANGIREGHVFPVAPLARLDDGLLDLVWLVDAPLVSRPWHVMQTLRGRVLELQAMRRRQVTSATIRAVERLPCHLDGEAFVLETGRSAEVRLLPGALRVVAPRARLPGTGPGVES